MSRPRPLNEMFPGASVEALDLMRLCMMFNPTKRISAKDAMRHPYCVQFHNPEDEAGFERTIAIPIDDNTKLTVSDYRDRLYNEVLRKKKEQRRSHRRTLEMQQQQQVVSQQPYASHASQNTAPYPQASSGSRPAHGSSGQVHGGVAHQSRSQGVPAGAQPQYHAAPGADYGQPAQQAYYQGGQPGVYDKYHGAQPGVHA